MSATTDDLQMEIASYTDAAGRESNEDAILAARLPGGIGYVLAVADGMGGYEHGEIASKLAIEALQAMTDQSVTGDIATALKQSFRTANQDIFEYGAANAGGETLGTTLVAAIVAGKYATIANIGDSRAYLLRSNQLTQITQDHSVVGEQVARGELTETEARKSNQRNLLTASLGLSAQLERRLPAIYEITLLPEDALLLCSDGFHDVLEASDYQGLLRDRSGGDVARQLTDLAKARGTRDNVSAVVLRVGQSVTSVQRANLQTEIAEARPSTMSRLLIPVLAAIVLLVIVGVLAFFLV